MTEYKVILKDTDGYWISTDIVEGLKAAKEKAKYFLTTGYARDIGTTHHALGTYKVEVHAYCTDDCVWDVFL